VIAAADDQRILESASDEQLAILSEVIGVRGRPAVLAASYTPEV
jgi:hypothetical protein